MRGRISEVMTEIDRLLMMDHQMELVIVQLGRPEENATREEQDRWELSCDRCGRYCPPPTDFHTGGITLVRHKRKIMVTFGLCDDCRALEAVPA
jgi:hypothetical protein